MTTRSGARSGACLTLLASAAAVAVMATPAAAQRTGCGMTITRDTTLQQDLDCPRGPVITIVADGVTLDLGGHTVTAQFGTVISSEGHDRITVRNGAVMTEGRGIVMSGRRVRLEHLRGFGDLAAFELHDGSRNVVRDVDFSTRPIGPGGVLVRERGDTVTGSRLIGLTLEDTRRTTLTGNTILSGSTP